MTGPSGIVPIFSNLPLILASLRAAAGPGVPIVGMNYYDPFVPQAWSHGGLPAVQAEVAGVVAFNDVLESAYAAAGDPIADVESAFSVTDLTLVDGTPLASCASVSGRGSARRRPSVRTSTPIRQATGSLRRHSPTS